MEDDEDEEEEEDDDEDEEIPLDMEEIEAASKKARQEEELHSEHIQVLTIFKCITNLGTYSCYVVKILISHICLKSLAF